MKINVKTIDFKFKQQLFETVKSKVQKFKRLCTDIISIDVKLKLDKSDKAINKLCGIRLAIPGYDMISNTRSKTFEEAIAKAVEALERQIEKRKTKIKWQGSI